MVIMDGALTFHSKTSETRNLYFGTDLYFFLFFSLNFMMKFSSHWQKA